MLLRSRRRAMVKEDGTRDPFLETVVPGPLGLAVFALGIAAALLPLRCKRLCWQSLRTGSKVGGVESTSHCPGQGFSLVAPTMWKV